MLKSLPESLDETYERMLCKVENHAIEDARRILTLLCFASRPLTVHELIDGIAVETTNDVGLNRKRRLQDTNDIHGICPGLIEIGLNSASSTEISDEDVEPDIVPTVRIAHFSVQEYLESERIRHQQAAFFSLRSATAHAEISQICLLYILEPALTTADPQTLKEAYPLVHFAAEFWYHHYQEAERPDELNSVISKLFERQESFRAWIKMHDVDSGHASFRRTIGSPVYYASLLGLHQVLDVLVCVRQQVKRTRFSRPPPYKSSACKRISADSEISSHMQQLNSLSDSESIFQHPQEHRTNRNSQLDGQSGTVLQGMASEMHDSMTELWLDDEVDVNARGGYYENALQAASYRGHESVVQLLLDKGADVNAKGGFYGNALHAASVEGHELIVHMLLDEGADVNAQDEKYRTALQAASFGGHKSVVHLLLDKGADVNAHGGFYGNALLAASLHGYGSVAKLLLDKGADINAEGGWFGHALQAASCAGHESVVHLLLDKGADVNAQGEPHGNALQAASSEGRDSVVQLLLDKGADINAQGGYYGNALQAASSEGQESVVQLLLERGADVNAQGGFYGNALQAASRRIHDSIVQLLLEKGALRTTELQQST
jgi:ankyrin repeat protein